MLEQESDAPMRVALLSPCYWPEVRRGGERLVRELADGLLARGHLPSLITSHPGLPSRRIEAGLPVLRLPRPPQGPLLRRGYEPYRTHVPLSYAALRAGDYDVAHAVYAPDALAAARWRRRTGRPAVLTYLGIPDAPGLDEYRGRRGVVVRALQGCDAVVAISAHAARAFEDSLGYEPRVIHPGVDLKAFRPAACRAPAPTIVCAAAAEVPRKNVGLLTRAFALLRRELPDARLFLSRPRDLGAARSAGVDADQEGVEWADLDDRDALARAYAEGWVAVLPSTNEAFGLVLIEALASGTPVVGHASAAVPELIDQPEIGRLFERLDPDALSGTLLEALELARDPSTASACRAKAERYSTDRCTEDYVSLYSELLGRARGASYNSRRGLCATSR